MLSIYLENNNQRSRITDICTPITGKQLIEHFSNHFGIENDTYFFKNNGCLVGMHDTLHNGDIFLVPKLCGGKGGFGSMLRAIGAQIEKTTNREACRDLSGRRLRDINEEKRLKAWIEKQSKRDEEATDRKNRKLAKLCAEPKHEFKDKSYEEQRSALTERVEDAVESGFAVASVSASKRKMEQEVITKLKKKKKTILDLDDDIDSDDLESSDDSSDENLTTLNNLNSADVISDSSKSSSDEKHESSSQSPKSTDKLIDDTSR